MRRYAVLGCLVSGAAMAASLPDRLASYATQPDVVLTPPAGLPSPPMGSFLIPYAGKDVTRVGTSEVGASACSAELQFVDVPSSESRTEMWLVESGVGLRFGMAPIVDVGVSGSRKSIAGIEYELTAKRVIDPKSLGRLEECCLRAPETCTSSYVSEYWQGTGKIHRLAGSQAGIKAALTDITKGGAVNFGHHQSWTMTSGWATPQYFAYRVAAFQPRTCRSYMDDLPPRDGYTLFTGVSNPVGTEREARRDARNDARQQVVSYLGEEYHMVGDTAARTADALLSGVKDDLTCLDPTERGPSGDVFKARVRMFVDSGKLEGAAAPMKSGR